MKSYNHVARAEHIQKTLSKLDLEDDYEMVIEDCMLALTHYYIAALHVEGITPVHIDPPHTYRPPMDYFPNQPSQKLQKAMESLYYIEEIRRPHLRGTASYEASVVEKCLKCYKEGKVAFLEVIGDGAKQPEWLPRP